MSDNNPKMKVSIGADLADIKAGLAVLRRDLAGVGTAGKKAGSDASAGLAGLHSGARKLRGVLTGLFAGFTAGALFRGIITNTREAEDALAQLEAGLKSTKGIAGVTSKEIVALADSLAQVTTFGDDAIVSMASILATFTNIRGTVFKDTIPAILDLSARLGTDLSAAAIQVGKALNDPVKGLAALGKAGVTFSAEQKTLIEGFVKTGDVAKAQRIILDELATQMGGSAKAKANTFAGAVDQLKNSFGNLLEGDSGSGGMLAAKTAIQDLTKALNDPQVKAGFQAMIEGFAWMALKAAETIGTFNVLRIVVADTFRENADKSYISLLDRLSNLQDREARLIDGLKHSGLNRSLLTASVVGVGPTLEEVRAEIDEVQKLLDAQRQLASKQRLLADPNMINTAAQIRAGGQVQFFDPPGPARQAAPIIDSAAADKAADAARRKVEALRREMEKLRKESQDADAARQKELQETEIRASKGLRDVEIALMRAQGDEAGAAFAEIERKYAELIQDLKDAAMPAGIAIVNNLINLEKADAQLAAFKNKMESAISATRDIETSLGAQAGGGLITSTEADQRRADALRKELDIQIKLKASAQAYLKTLSTGSPEANKTLAFIELLNGRIGEVQQTQSSFAKDVEDQLVLSLTGFFSDLASGAKSFKDAFLDMVRSFVAGITQMIAKQLALNAVKAIGAAFGVWHQGGIVGQSPAITRRVSPLLLGDAPRFHGGGIAGLGPTEVPAILQRGEEVLTRGDARHRLNGGATGGRNLVTTPIVAIGDAAVADAMAGAAGTNVILTVVRNHWGALSRGVDG
jgi:hypothetical protein